MRRFLATTVLAMSMLACGFYAQDKPASKGFDLMSCSSKSFAAGHVLFSGNDLRIESVSPAPGEVDKMAVDDVANVYKFVRKNKDDYSYERMVGEEKFQVVIDYKKGTGTFSIDGESKSFIYIMNDEDGSKLAENAKKAFAACQIAVEDDQPPQVSLDKT